MRTLVYKRTHSGDPDASGRFGVYDCMGRVRAWNFEAVIGVGGIGREPESYGLDTKVNWIGIGPHKRAAADKRGPIVTFDHFIYYGPAGPDFVKAAPALARRIYSRNVRALMDGATPTEAREIAKLLELAKRAPPSPARGGNAGSSSKSCAPVKPRRGAHGC